MDAISGVDVFVMWTLVDDCEVNVLDTGAAAVALGDVELQPASNAVEIEALRMSPRNFRCIVNYL